MAVICRQGRFLVIRRAAGVVAPGAYCFPGGGIEPGEAEPAALVRELKEELDLEVQPVRLLWRSTTPWKVRLAWWLGHVAPDATPVPNPAEVAAFCWCDAEEMRALPGLLESNQAFLDSLRRGEFRLD